MSNSLMWLTPFLYLSRGGSILILAIRRNAVKGLRVEFSGGNTTRPLTEREPASFPVRGSSESCSLWLRRGRVRAAPGNGSRDWSLAGGEGAAPPSVVFLTRCEPHIGVRKSYMVFFFLRTKKWL